MRANEYQQLAMTTNGQTEFTHNITMAAMGLSGEAGEVVDVVKKYLFHGHVLDDKASLELRKEAGDILWYLALLLTTLGREEYIAS